MGCSNQMPRVGSPNLQRSRIVGTTNAFADVSLVIGKSDDTVDRTAKVDLLIKVEGLIGLKRERE